MIGFASGLISVPLLSLFMPVQDAVTIVMLFQLAMGLLAVKTRKQIMWDHIRALLPGMVIGVILGVFALKYIQADTMRLILAGYLILHLLRTHTRFDPLKKPMQWGGAAISGFAGGAINAMIGGGGPAFIPYLKDKCHNHGVFRANLNAILVISNIPRLAGAIGTGMLHADLLILSLYAVPAFILAMVIGQYLHDKVPQRFFFIAVDVVLICTIVSLLLKVAL